MLNSRPQNIYIKKSFKHIRDIFNVFDIYLHTTTTVVALNTECNPEGFTGIKYQHYCVVIGMEFTCFIGLSVFVWAFEKEQPC